VRERTDALGLSLYTSLGVANLVAYFPTLSLLPGKYDVQTYWPAGSGRSAVTPHDIVHANGTTRVLVNQKVQP
jgi:hypothetical protein